MLLFLTLERRDWFAAPIPLASSDGTRKLRQCECCISGESMAAPRVNIFPAPIRLTPSTKLVQVFAVPPPGIESMAYQLAQPTVPFSRYYVTDKLMMYLRGYRRKPVVISCYLANRCEFQQVKNNVEIPILS